MEDIIIIDPEQTEYDQIDIYNPIQEDKKNIENIDNIEIVGEESIKDESKQVNQSDSIIFDSNDINNLRSTQNIDVKNYDSFVLWTNPNPNKSFVSDYYTIDDDIDNYDLLGFEYRNYTGNNITNIYYIKVEDFKNLTGSTSNRLGLNVQFNGSTYTKFLYYNSDTSVWFSPTYKITNGSTDGTLAVPIKIYGYKAKSLSNNDIQNVPSVSGNNITNNYYITVSANDPSLSYNLLNKPLNNYSVSESILLFIFMGLFVAAFSHFIKKNIFKL